MIGYLKGRVMLLTPEYVLLEVNGVGYEVVCSGAAFSKLANVEVGEVYTYLQVKEDGATLFGFADVAEKQMFLRLLTVSGVGAKSAIALLSSMRPEELTEAIATADVKRISAVKGLGKKTAERIVLELHGKISADDVLGASENAGPASGNDDDDAIAALMNLGFSKAESANAVSKAKKAGAKTIEQIIAAALRGM